MAVEKDITMKQFNGTDFDTLYPKTLGSQVEDIYTEEQMLSDSTKTLLGLSSTATPDDAFQKIDSDFCAQTDEIEKVGTIKYTVLNHGNGVPNNWTQCDGSVINRDTYPELSKWLHTPYYSSKTLDTSSSYQTEVSKTCYHDGVWAAAGSGYVWYTTTTDLSVTWTQSTSSIGSNIKDFKYLDRWCVLWVQGEAGYTQYLKLSQAATMAGPWNTVTITTGTNIRNNDFFIESYNGKLVIVTNGLLLWYMDESMEAFKTYQIPTTSFTYQSPAICGIKCINGHWVIGGYSNTDNNSIGHAILYEVEDANFLGEWTESYTNYIKDHPIELKDLDYGNGNVVLTGRISTGYIGQALLFYRSLADGEWSNYLFSDSRAWDYNGVGSQFFNDSWNVILKIDDKWGVATSSSPAGPWTYNVYWSVPDDASLEVNSLTGYNNTWIAGAYYSQHATVYICEDLARLPTIEPEGYNAWIKVKKDSEVE